MENMKILMVNKFLYPNGGSETYIFKIGEYLQSQGHEVQYFGMEHEGRVVGNAAESYTSNMDFHTGKLQKLLYPLKIIYSVEARKKIRAVLKKFKPDVVHLNNFNFQLTPSIIYEIKKFGVPIVYTAHDYQLICPNHMMFNPSTNAVCDYCAKGNFIHCKKGKCIHKSTVKSILGSMEGYLYRWLRVYRYIDTIICPSRFLEQQLKKSKVLADKTVALHNFIDQKEWKEQTKEDYVLYFGRYSEEKGIKTLLEVCRKLPNIPFVFAGNGPLEAEVNVCKNVKNVGFQTGELLTEIIQKARFTVIASEWYENCPFSVMEAQTYGTPVLGANIGGIPELIQVSRTGELFESGNAEALQEQIETFWNDRDRCTQYAKNCENIKFDTIGEYCDKLVKIYAGSNKNLNIENRNTKNKSTSNRNMTSKI